MSRYWPNFIAGLGFEFVIQFVGTKEPSHIKRVAVGVLLAILPAVACADTGKREISNPQWWFEQARYAAELIDDPEDRAMVRQMISGFEGKLAPAEDLTRSLEKLRAKYQAERGEDAEWLFELEAARQYEAAQRYVEALEAWIRARFHAQKRIDQEKNNVQRAGPLNPRPGGVRWEFRSVLNSVATSALNSGHPQVAFEAVELCDADEERDMLLRGIASWQAKVDINAAEATLRRISPQWFAREWRLLLIQQCMEGKREQYERALRQIIDDRPTMTAREASECYRTLAQALCSAPTDLDAALLARFSEQLNRDTLSDSDADLPDEAKRCQAALLVSTGRFSEARMMVDRRGRTILEGGIGETAVRRLIAEGKFEEAERLVPTSQNFLSLIATELTKAGRLVEALAVIERFPERGNFNAGYCFEIARLFAERGDWDGVRRSIAITAPGESMIGALGQMAKVARRNGNSKQAAELLNEASQAVPLVAHTEERKEAAVALATIYLDDNQLQTAWIIVDQYGDNIARASVLVRIAEKQIDRRDAVGYQASLAQLESIVGAPTLYDRLKRPQRSSAGLAGFEPPGAERPPLPMGGRFTPVPPGATLPALTVPGVPSGAFPTIPSAPVRAPTAEAARPKGPSMAEVLAEIRYPKVEISKEERSQIQVQFGILIARLYLRVGDKAKAQRAIKAGFDRAGLVDGSFWRFEMYAELFGQDSTPQNLTDIADMLEVVPTATDRALIACLGGGLAAKLQKEAQPANAVPAIPARKER